MIDSNELGSWRIFDGDFDETRVAGLSDWKVA
jgi:hypothetical protein